MSLDDLINKTERFHQVKSHIFEKYISHILLFLFRMIIAIIFFRNGLEYSKDIEYTILLFQNEYIIPFINPSFATYSVIFFEIICSIMLAVGFFVRIASLPLIIISFIDQYVAVTDGYYLHWIVMLLTIITFGAGKITLGNILKKVATIFKTKSLARRY